MYPLPEILFASSDPSQSKKIRSWLKEGRIRPLISRAYTSNLEDPLEQIVRRNIWLLVSHMFPEALISHRTAIEYRISPKNNLYLTAGSRRVYRWPGVNIRMTDGVGPLEDDGVFMHDLRVSSLERACLENLSSSRNVEGEKRTVGQAVIEDRLLSLLYTRGEDGLNELRDRAKEIASILGTEKAFEKLNQIIGALLATQPVKVLNSSRATAQALGEPYDSGRLDLFSVLLAQLKQRSFPLRPTKTTSAEAFSNFSFFEAYFSNYIEGTVFLVEEAREIVYEGHDIPLRVQDSHDIRGTYQIVGNRKVMSITPQTAHEFVQLLRARHAVILGGRPEKNPGAFKTRKTRAGDTVFVAPQFVLGTLKQGFAMMASLDDPLARAIYMMFLVSEVHPFDDGNGRIARIMMNAELVYGGSSKIIIPTVYRDDYMLALRRLTRQKDASVFVRMMERAAAFSHWLEPVDWEGMNTQLKKANAYKESDQDGAVLRWS